MISNSLCLAPRVSPNKEKLLWDSGIHNWATLSKESKHGPFFEHCEQQLQAQNCGFFAAHLKSDQHWRLFSEFRHDVAYIDIETTGLSKFDCQITTIALFDGNEIKTYVQGKNLADFKSEIQKYSLIVTFNGKTFDVPFIEHHFSFKIQAAHIDLRYVMKRLGFAGGLKSIERQLGMDRAELNSVDGFFAVYLWHEYRRTKNQAALDTLLAYNCADVLNLEHLMVYAYNQNIKQTPFGETRSLPSAKVTAIPFKVDLNLLRKFGCL
jgi:uncharacterized protein